METLYTDENIEQIERYFEGDLSAEELAAFDKQMQEDAAFKQLVEQHKLLQEGIQWASYQEEKAKLRDLHRAIVEEDKEEVAVKSKVVRFDFRRLSSIAAIFLIGLFLGLGPYVFQQFNQKPIAQNNNDSLEDNYGGTDDGLPLFENTVSLIIWNENAAGLQKQEKNLQISIAYGKEEEVRYLWEDKTLRLFIQDISDVEDWDNATIAVVLEQLQAPKMEVALLKINDFMYQIPLSHEDFSSIFNQ